jgi:tRNA (Thr-GGU) A37 N-methylase
MLNIDGVDIVDGTPLLDIKPYVPEFDVRQDFKTGWYETAGNKQQKIADDRFTLPKRNS